MDASKLLTNDELKAVIGEVSTQIVPSTRVEAGFAISQCYFALPIASNSVVLTVTRRSSDKNGRDPRAFWMSKFHPGKEEEPNGEREEERTPVEPIKIDGIGDEAFWVPSGEMGALYVLHNVEFLRVAIGGSDDTATKIRKSTELARLALKRL